MKSIKVKSKKNGKQRGDEWFANERYRNFLPPEKTHFPKKLEAAKKSLANMQWMD